MTPKEKHRLRSKMKSLRPGKLDALVQAADERAFQAIDCLECANCCKTTGPLFIERDIQRISKHLGMSVDAFEEEYLRVDEDEDKVLQELPCPFLGPDNYCSIYEVRPKACREYPHTHQAKQHRILSLTFKNAEICPAVEHVLADIQNALNR